MVVLVYGIIGIFDSMRLKYSDTFLFSHNPTKRKRKSSTKRKFLRIHNMKSVPNGYEVDHVIPLHLGGSDTVDNMQFLSISEHKQKTAAEMKEYFSRK